MELSRKQMAVHDYGELMVVSFAWKLSVRHAAPVVAGAAAVPGAVAPSEQSLRKKM